MRPRSVKKREAFSNRSWHLGQKALIVFRERPATCVLAMKLAMKQPDCEMKVMHWTVMPSIAPQDASFATMNAVVFTK
jgi:hypothetical protein